MREKVLKTFGRTDECINCCKETSYLVETFYSEEEDGVIGNYECDCGYKQKMKIQGKFVDWYQDGMKEEEETEEEEDIASSPPTPEATE